MSKISVTSFVTVAMIGFLVSGPAGAWVIDFDDGVGGEFAANTIFGNGDGTSFQRYTAGIPASAASVAISADNNRSSGPDLAVGFDSTNGSSRDNDLEELFDPIGGSASSGYGNILIIQSGENDFTSSCATTPGSGGVCDGNRADDEAQGGTLTFSFDQSVRLFGLDIFDTEEGGGQVTFLDEDGIDIVGTPLTAPNVGDNGVGFMDFGSEGIIAKTLIVEFRGSGALDNIRGDTVSQVTEPATLGLFGASLIALGLYRRRQRSERRL